MLQSNQATFPMLFKIAMDYLPIQASLVPSECVFSSSAETDTKKHNLIHPMLMEALQMLKFTLKKEQLNFTQGWITSESMMSKQDFDSNDLLSQLLGADNKEGVVDEIICRFGDDNEIA